MRSGSGAQHWEAPPFSGLGNMTLSYDVRMENRYFTSHQSRVTSNQKIHLSLSKRPFQKNKGIY